MRLSANTESRAKLARRVILQMRRQRTQGFVGRAALSANARDLAHQSVAKVSFTSYLKEHPRRISCPRGICRNVRGVGSNLPRQVNGYASENGGAGYHPAFLSGRRSLPAEMLRRCEPRGALQPKLQFNTPPQPLCGRGGASRYNPHELSFPCLPGEPCRSPGGNSSRLLKVLAAPHPGAVQEQHASGRPGNRLPGETPQ